MHNTFILEGSDVEIFFLQLPHPPFTQLYTHNPHTKTYIHIHTHTHTNTADDQNSVKRKESYLLLDKFQAIVQKIV